MIRPFGDFLTFACRILFLYVIWMACRAGFYFYNLELVGPIAWGEFPALLRGALIFDSASIFYINGPFLLLSLLPFRFRRRAGYQRMLLWIFVIVNSVGLIVNLADIFYYPFKLGRIASDDAHFLGNGNFGALLGSFLIEYWYALLGWIAIGFLLGLGFKKIGYRATVIRNDAVYYISQTALLALAGFFAVFMIRGGNLSGATYPVNLSDAGLYASPAKAGLILSNPFCVIRTSGDSFSALEYFAPDEAEAIFSPVHRPDSSLMRIPGRPNVMLIILESFGAAHIKALSTEFPAEAPSFTPFLDSLVGQGFAFRNAYHNGSRSLDALPSLWASIPTFKKQFLSMPQSVAEYHALPRAMGEMGYTTAFLHGAVRESMSFQAFGRMVGVERFWSQEDYEAEHGKGDFDGKWGIWDHAFFPFIAQQVNTLPEPFFATMFSLSSHHPFILPAGYDDGRYPEGELPIQRMIAYSDDALRRMFAQMTEHEWFENTIFILTADHGSGADNERYRQVPYNFAVPLLFYSPGGWIPAGVDDRPAGHIDLMPTLLGMVGYEKPYFAFGQDLFAADSAARRTINYMGAFNAIADSGVYIFNEREFVPEAPEADARWTKAFIQHYYQVLRGRDYTAE
jgi:phosphoglycerol transferase MdoB-like AlkP superfamily enzyme